MARFEKCSGSRDDSGVIRGAAPDNFLLASACRAYYNSGEVTCKTQVYKLLHEGWVIFKAYFTVKADVGPTC